ncbi:MAG: hypothetical protein L0K34_09230 [Ancrocorticia sp.]|nr:hypothetical protein [Ancrocorticia sp.]
MIELVTTRAQLERCWAIRFAVFVDEQQVPLDEEVDQLDTAPSTIHLLAVVDGKDVGTLRILPEEAGHCHIGRVAVSGLARGTGVGRVRIELSSQEQAMGFYRACGYEVVSGKRYLDAGIWHEDMVQEVSLSSTGE